MLRIIVIIAAFGFCSSNPPTILDYVNHVGPYGYFFRYSTSDGIGREESGELKSPGTPEENYVVQGKTSWTSPEGIPYVVTFISDNNGYRISSPDTYQSYVPSIFFVGPPAIGPLNPPTFNPSTSLIPQQRAIYSTTSLQSGSPTVNPSTQLRPQQHSVYSTASPQSGSPTVNPSTQLRPQQHVVYSTASLQPGSPTVNPSTQLRPQQHVVYSTASLQPGSPSVIPSIHLAPQQHAVYSTASLQPGSPSVIPSIHLGPQQHSIESLQPGHHAVNSLTPFPPQQQSIIEHLLQSGLQSERPTLNPSTLLDPHQHSIDSLQPEINTSRPTVKPTTSSPSIRPVQPYVPPPKSASFGPEEDRLPANQQTSTGDIQRTAEGVVPAGPPKIGAGTAAALVG